MHTKQIHLCFVLIALSVSVDLAAQALPTVTSSPTALARPDLTPMFSALRVRVEAVASVANGSEKPAAAILRLKVHALLSGLPIDRDADFAFAAIDIGQRLVAKGKYAEAEVFFREAEKSLLPVVAKTPDTAANDKAMYLQKLALLHGQYLNNAVQAKADIEAAITLRPNDKYSQGLRDSLANSNGQFLIGQPKG